MMLCWGGLIKRMQVRKSGHKSANEDNDDKDNNDDDETLILIFTSFLI